MTDISVIIVNHKAADYVRRAIAALPAAAGGLRWETIVMDNSDEPQDVGCADHWRPVENRGFGTACNEGARLARGRLLLFLNPDSELEPGALSGAAECLETWPEAGLVGIRTQLPDGSFEAGCLRGVPTPGRALCYYLGLEKLFPRSHLCGGYHMTWLDRRRSAEVDSVSGSFMLLRRELFEQLGGFDEEYFMYGEDLDLCLRVREKGLKVVYFAGGRMLHHHGKCGRNPRQTAAFYDSMAIFYDKHLASRYPSLTGRAVHAAVALLRRRALRELEREND